MTYCSCVIDEGVDGVGVGAVADAGDGIDGGVDAGDGSDGGVDAILLLVLEAILDM